MGHAEGVVCLTLNTLHGRHKNQQQLLQQQNERSFTDCVSDFAN